MAAPHLVAALTHLVAALTHLAPTGRVLAGITAIGILAVFGATLRRHYHEAFGGPEPGDRPTSRPCPRCGSDNDLVATTCEYCAESLTD